MLLVSGVRWPGGSAFRCACLSKPRVPGKGEWRVRRKNTRVLAHCSLCKPSAALGEGRITSVHVVTNGSLVQLILIYP